MQIISHRINTLALLKKTPKVFGIEVDIRSNENKLIIHHDPFEKGEEFEEWIKCFNHKTLILNVKEEGLEERLLILMEKYKIEDFFFLDQSFPFLRKTAFNGESRCAVRVSEYEDINTALSLARRIDWVWVDCFSRFPLIKETAQQLQNAGFKLCFVSPELQGRDADTEIPLLFNELYKLDIFPEAVCTKRPELWKNAQGLK
jgi:hypothetical protein